MVEDRDISTPRPSGPRSGRATKPEATPRPPAEADGAHLRPAAQDEPFRILVIDDEDEAREVIAATGRMLDCRVQGAQTIHSALSLITAGTFDLVFLDLVLDDADGATLLPRLLAADPDLQVVVITAYASIQTAVRCIKSGATDYLEKPVEPHRLRTLIEQAQQDRRRARAMSGFETGNAVAEPLLTTRSSIMRPVVATLLRAASSEVPVLLRGESGTGKGTLAAAIHRRGSRTAGPFITIDCPTLEERPLADPASRSGRPSRRTGIDAVRWEAAAGGTLLLDEIGELSTGAQARLLRQVQDLRSPASPARAAVDVRIIATTDRDLTQAVVEGRFLEDLYYRLNVVEVVLPPLRERREDILDLARYFLDTFTTAVGRPRLELSSAAQALLVSYDWPGNLRELRNEMQRITVLWSSRVVEPEAFSDRLHRPGDAGPRLGGDYTLADIETEHLRQVLGKANTFEAASRILGIEPSTLWRKRRRLGL